MKSSTMATLLVPELEPESTISSSDQQMRCVVDGQAGVAFGVGERIAAFDDAEGVFAGFA